MVHLRRFAATADNRRVLANHIREASEVGRREAGDRPPWHRQRVWQVVFLPQSAGEKKLPCREQVKCHARFQLKCQQFERFCGRAREAGHEVGSARSAGM